MDDMDDIPALCAWASALEAFGQGEGGVLSDTAEACGQGAVLLAAARLRESASRPGGEFPPFPTHASVRTFETDGSGWQATVRFDLREIRRAALSAFLEGRDAGWALPREAVLRREAAESAPALRRRHLESAADHAADHAVTLAASLPGAARTQTGAVWHGSGPGRPTEADFAWLAADGPGAFPFEAVLSAGKETA